MKISEIAKLAGVSSAAVSRYLNGGSISEEKKQVIKRVIEETGYVPNLAARSLRRQQSDSVGIIVPRINSDSVSSLVEGVSSVLNHAGYLVVFGNAQNDEKREIEYLRMMQEAKLSGVILMGTVFTPNHIKFFRETKLPIVVCGQYHPSVSCIYHDDRGAAKELTRCMIESGRRSLAYIGAVETDLCVGINRRLGVEDALTENGLSPDELLKVQVRFTVEEGYRGMCEILDGGHMPDGVICATDSLAVGAVKALRERGVNIPGEVSIGGIGGGASGSYLTPSLTTVRLFHRQSGEMAARLILSMIKSLRETPEEKPPVTHTMLGYEMIKRESIAQKECK